MAAPIVQSFSGTSTSTGTVTVTAPTGVADGDLIVFVANTDFGVSGTVVYTPPTGVTELFPYTRANAGGSPGVSYQAWYKVASSEAGSYILTVSEARLSGFSAIRIDGQNTSTPVDGTIGTAVTSGEPINPGYTTTVDNCLILHSVGWDESKTFTAAPTGDTGVGSIDVSGLDQWNYQRNQDSAGSVVPGTWDISSATRYVAVTIAIQPVAAAPATVITGWRSLLGVGR